jgi:hypothetical protein
MRSLLCLLLVAGCAVDPDEDSGLVDVEEFFDDKGELDEKHRLDAIESCTNVCVDKYVAGCPAMDTVDEYLGCRDWCWRVQTYPTECEAQYIDLNECFSSPAPQYAYTCNAAGNPVPTTSCMPQRTMLAYCDLIH